MKKTITLTVQQAKELYENDNSFRGTILSEFTDVELGIKKELKGWSELGVVNGYSIDPRTGNTIGNLRASTNFKHNEFIFSNEKQAESARAMAKLSQLMADLGDECEVDWGVDSVQKYSLKRVGDNVLKNTVYREFHFISFKTGSVRDAFLEKHEELIKQYFMI